MSNVHRFKPRPKAPPPRRRLSWARAAWLPWVLIAASAVVVVLTGDGDGGALVAALAVILAGAWLHGRA